MTLHLPRRLLLGLLFGLLFASQVLLAAEPLTIGVFAFRDKAETIKKYQPLAA